MPIIMPLAFSTNLQRIISAKEYNPDMKDKVLCEDVNCRIDVAHVRKYERQYGNHKINVEAFFRLKSKYFKHTNECKYNVNNQIKVIARFSNSAIIETIEEGHFKFRINLVYDEFKILVGEEPPLPISLHPVKKNQKSIKYIHDGEIIPYISTMKKIMELRTKLAGNDELSNLIRLEIKDHASNQTKEIFWDDFYYTLYNYKKLYGYVSSNTCQHIICIEGKIRTFNEPSNKFPYYNIKLESPAVKRIGSTIVKVPSLQLLLDNQKIFEFIKENSPYYSRIAAFAIFKTPKKRTSELKQIEYLNIS
ncbi:hypothetical protein, partial [Clostridium sp.]|uniref:hypothetical protein n=1 Tax=Clostridium sp. TaxID=1506 RepID=UPI003EEC3C0E